MRGWVIAVALAALLPPTGNAEFRTDDPEDYVIGLALTPTPAMGVGNSADLFQYPAPARPYVVIPWPGRPPSRVHE